MVVSQSLLHHFRLAGFSLNEQTDAVIEQTAEWYRTKAPPDEQLVRMSYLWIAGSFGNERQVQTVLKETEKWLQEHDTNYCVRIPYLLFVIGRGSRRNNMVTPAQRNAAINKTEKWLIRQPDELLVEAALQIVKSQKQDEKPL